MSEDYSVDRVRGLDDLRNWNYPGTAITVIGHPINHSLSPPMHNAALEAMAKIDSRFADWRYFRFDIEPEALVDALPIFYEKGFEGINLTLPHKVKALNLVAQVDPIAAGLGAVNTLWHKADGYHGFNTDGFGIKTAIKETLGLSLKDQSVLILGAGGASRAIAVQCIASGVKELFIGNRNQERLTDLLRIVEEQNADAAIPVHGFDLMNPPSLPRDALIINATSLGLKENDPAPLSLDLFSPQSKVYDTTYGPASNGLRREADRRGLSYANGLSMLVWQGVRSLEIWSQAQVPAAVMTAVVQSKFKNP